MQFSVPTRGRCDRQLYFVTMSSNGIRIAVAAFEMESWPVAIVRAPTVVCAPRDPFPPRPASSGRTRRHLSR